MIRLSTFKVCVPTTSRWTPYWPSDQLWGCTCTHGVATGEQKSCVGGLNINKGDRTKEVRVRPHRPAMMTQESRGVGAVHVLEGALALCNRMSNVPYALHLSALHGRRRSCSWRPHQRAWLRALPVGWIRWGRWRC